MGGKKKTQRSNGTNLELGTTLLSGGIPTSTFLPHDVMREKMYMEGRGERDSQRVPQSKPRMALKKSIKVGL